MTYVHPNDYAIQPKQFRIFDNNKGARKVAVMMPYPSIEDRELPCLNMLEFTTEYGEGFDRLDAMNEAHCVATCTDCPVRVACGEWGIAHEEHFVFGGLTPKARVKIRKDRGQVLVHPYRAHEYGMGDPWFEREQPRRETVAVKDVFAGDLDIGEYPDGAH